MTATPDQIGAWIAAIVAGGAAVFERVKNVRDAKKREANAEAISDAKKHQERAEVMAKLAEDYKKLFENEHKEFNEYRDYAHTKANADQLMLSKAQERIQDLNARPDFTDLFQHLKTQSDVSVQILHGIEGMVGMMKQLLERESILRKNHDTI